MVFETTLEPQPLYSSLAGDPLFAETVEVFVDGLPVRVAKLIDYSEQCDWEGLGRIANQLKGSVGSFGFSGITPFANRLELAVTHNEPGDVVQRVTDDLIGLCRRVRKGNGNEKACLSPQA